LIKTSLESVRRNRLVAVIVLAAVLLGVAAFVWREYKQRSEYTRIAELAQRATADGDREAGQNNFDLAIEKYKEAIRLNPSNTLAYYKRGGVYLEIKQLDDALADFDAVIKLDANHAGAYVGRGDVYWQKRDLTNALAAYNRAIDLDPNLPDAYTNRGKVLAEQGALNQALTDYKSAIERSRNNPIPFLWRGAAHSKSGDYDVALEDFNQALSLKADLSEAYVKRADTYLKRNGPGDSEQAINDYDTALKTELGKEGSYNPELYLNRGKAYANTGKAKPAVDDFDKAIKLSQDKPEYSTIKADALAQLRKLQPRPTPTPRIESPAQNPPPVVTAQNRPNPTIYLYYGNEKDIRTLNKITAALQNLLKESNYKVSPKSEQITLLTTGDVRYFHKEDEAAAKRIKEIVENTLRANRIEKSLDLRPMLRKLGRSVPRGWIEIWLPSLPQPTYRPAIKNSPVQSAPKPQSQSYKPISKN
jgi:tetratricopeptide (TPR) repeat protein